MYSEIFTIGFDFWLSFRKEGGIDADDHSAAFLINMIIPVDSLTKASSVTIFKK